MILNNINFYGLYDDITFANVREVLDINNDIKNTLNEEYEDKDIHFSISYCWLCIDTFGESKLDFLNDDSISIKSTFYVSYLNREERFQVVIPLKVYTTEENERIYDIEIYLENTFEESENQLINQTIDQIIKSIQETFKFYYEDIINNILEKIRNNKSEFENELLQFEKKIQNILNKLVKANKQIEEEQLIKFTLDQILLNLYSLNYIKVINRCNTFLLDEYYDVPKSIALPLPMPLYTDLIVSSLFDYFREITISEVLVDMIDYRQMWLETSPTYKKAIDNNPNNYVIEKWPDLTTEEKNFYSNFNQTALDLLNSYYSEKNYNGLNLKLKTNKD